MNDNELRLSEYIDKLNNEQQPEQHGMTQDSPELERLYNTVRLVRSIREPALPEGDYAAKLVSAVTGRQTPNGDGSLKNSLGGKEGDQRRQIRHKVVKPKKRTWFTGLAGMAAVLVIALMLSSLLPFGQSGIVYAMEKAFKNVKAYYGILEIVQHSENGEQSLQAKLEIWADKQGRYYVKGLEGWQKGIITANNGQRKWQIRPDLKEVSIFPAFPDAYGFIFELGREIDRAADALSVKTLGQETVAGREADVIEVTPQGGQPYRIWVDKQTKLPLQKQTAMQNALQYTVTYTEIGFEDTISEELMAYNLPNGYREVDTNPEQLVSSIEEAAEIAGFTPVIPGQVPEGYSLSQMAVMPEKAIVKLYYKSQQHNTTVITMQQKSDGEFKPAGTAMLGKLDGNIAEVQSPVYDEQGILGGGGLYAGITDISSIRWRQDGYEYAVVGNVSMEIMAKYAEGISGGTFEIPSQTGQPSDGPAVKVPVDMEVEQNEQKSVDAGSSPWKLDPAFVAQVFVSLKMSPEGITGEHPIAYEDLEVVENNGINAVIEVAGNKTPIRKVYLERLVRQDSTGIWTVVGYDPAE
jgi:outer membrane lipoprotein-sorting protein